MAKYLITGVAGFIGSALARAVLAQGGELRGIDNLSTGKRGNIAELLPRMDFREADILDLDAMRYACATSTSLGRGRIRLRRTPACSRSSSLKCWREKRRPSSAMASRAATSLMWTMRLTRICLRVRLRRRRFRDRF